MITTSSKGRKGKERKGNKHRPSPEDINWKLKWDPPRFALGQSPWRLREEKMRVFFWPSTKWTESSQRWTRREWRQESEPAYHQTAFGRWVSGDATDPAQVWEQQLKKNKKKKREIWISWQVRIKKRAKGQEELNEKERKRTWEVKCAREHQIRVCGRHFLVDFNQNRRHLTRTSKHIGFNQKERKKCEPQKSQTCESPMKEAMKGPRDSRRALLTHLDTSSFNCSNICIRSLDRFSSWALFDTSARAIAAAFLTPQILSLHKSTNMGI